MSQIDRPGNGMSDSAAKFAALAEQTWPGASHKGPFKFLEYFTDKDAGKFTGRDAEIAAVVAGLAKNRSFVLYGGSGSGKTSLLLAGVLPTLSGRGFRCIYLRTLADPLEDLRSAVVESDPSLDDDTSVQEAVASIGRDAPVVIVIDQFEEFFIRFRNAPEKRDAFVKVIAALVNSSGVDCRVAFSLRDDYLAELDDFRGRLPNLFLNEYRLRSLTAFGARRAIAAQLDAAGVDYDQGFLTRAVDFLEEYRYDPTILQIVCAELYRRAEAKSAGAAPRLTAENVESIGDLKQLFTGYLDDLVRELGDERRLLARVVLDALMTDRGTKRAVTMAEIERVEFVTTREEVVWVLNALVSTSLVRRDRRGATVWYELVHERLVEVARDWLERDEDFFRYRSARDAIVNGLNSPLWQRTHEGLLSAGQLGDAIREFRDRLDLDALEIDFVVRSAVFRCCGEDLLYWYKRGKSEALQQRVLSLLDDEHAAMRRPAVEALVALRKAGELDDGADLGAKLTDMALGDAGEEVRRAAARALADFGRSDDFSRIMAAYGDPDKRAAARETAVLLEQAGCSPREIGLLRRLRARRIGRRRTLGENTEQIDRARSAALLRGTVAGVLWSFIVATPVSFWVLWSHGILWSDRDTTSDFLKALGIVFPLALAGAAIIGRSAGSVVVKAELLRRRRWWFGLAMRAGRPLYLLFPVATFILVVFDDWDFNEDVLAALLLAVVVAFITNLMVASITAIGSFVVGGGEREEVWGWSFFACNGPLLALPLLFTGLASFMGATLMEDVVISTVFFCVVCLVATVVVVNLAEPLAESHIAAAPGSGLRTRQLFVIAAVLVMLTNLGLFGLDTLPWFAARYEIAASNAGGSEPVVIEDHLGPGWPDADHHQLVVSADEGDEPLHLLRIAQHTVGLRIAGQELLPGGEEVLALPSGRHWLAVVPVRFQEELSVPYHLEIASVPLISADRQLAALRSEAWTFVRCRAVFVPAGEGEASAAQQAPTQRLGARTATGAQRPKGTWECEMSGSAAQAWTEGDLAFEAVEVAPLSVQLSMEDSSFWATVTMEEVPQPGAATLPVTAEGGMQWQEYYLDFNGGAAAAAVDPPRPVREVGGYGDYRQQRPIYARVGDDGTWAVKVSLRIDGEEFAEGFVNSDGTVRPIDVVVAAKRTRLRFREPSSEYIPPSVPELLPETEALALGEEETPLRVGEAQTFEPQSLRTATLLFRIEDTGWYEIIATSLDSDLKISVDEDYGDGTTLHVGDDDDSYGGLNPRLETYLTPGNFRVQVSDYNASTTDLTRFTIIVRRSVEGF